MLGLVEASIYGGRDLVVLLNSHAHLVVVTDHHARHLLLNHLVAHLSMLLRRVNVSLQPVLVQGLRNLFLLAQHH